MHIDQVIPLVQEVSQTNQIESDLLFQIFKVSHVLAQSNISNLRDNFFTGMTRV